MWQILHVGYQLRNPTWCLLLKDAELLITEPLGNWLRVGFGQEFVHHWSNNLARMFDIGVDNWLLAILLRSLFNWVSVCVCVWVCVCVCVWVWCGMQQYDVVELLGRRVGPLTCVVSRLHSAGSSVRTADVTADSVLFSLVELTFSWCLAQLTRLARTSYILKLFWCWTRKQM